MSIVCKNCGLIDSYSKEKRGPHITAICSGCGSYIKHLPQEGPFIIPFGKYKGRELGSMLENEEISYLEWMSNQDWCKSNIKNRIIEHIKKLQ